MTARFSFDSASLPDLRAQFGAQADFLDQVSHHAFDTARQLGELNVRRIILLMRQVVDDGIRIGRALLACNDPLQMGSVALRETQPAAEHLRSWQSLLMSVLASSGATLAHDANDGGWQAARRATGAEDVGAAHNPT
ncbi:hypothetical protein [Massilia suwonensis]|uniref:Phasin domain-containing protein n=1 Tax=Massilia suwonensis TaxID=648895 RepID=A0ABW0MSS1_9BURK